MNNKDFKRRLFFTDLFHVILIAGCAITVLLAGAAFYFSWIKYGGFLTTIGAILFCGFVYLIWKRSK